MARGFQASHGVIREPSAPELIAADSVEGDQRDLRRRRGERGLVSLRTEGDSITHRSCRARLLGWALLRRAS
jgi:hypothetical protein